MRLYVFATGKGWLFMQGSVGVNKQDDDFELVLKARRSELGAFDRLCGNYSAMINKILASFEFRASERDDLYQEGLIGLYKATVLYDSNISSFSTFAYICIRRSVISALKKQSSVYSTIDIDEINENDFSLLEATNPEALFLSKESYDSLLVRIDSVLSPYESRVLKLYLHGISHNEIAASVGKDKKSVDNAISRIKLKLRQQL